MTAYLQPTGWSEASPDPSAQRWAERSWRTKLRDSLRGLKLGIRGHSSFFVHFFFTALLLAAGIVLRCSALEWCLLLGSLGAVLIAELFNSAVETLYFGLDEFTRQRLRPAPDIAGAAVFLAGAIAIVIGAIVFFGRLTVLFS